MAAMVDQARASLASGTFTRAINVRTLEARIHLYDSHGMIILISATYKKSPIEVFCFKLQRTNIKLP